MPRQLLVALVVIAFAAFDRTCVADTYQVGVSKVDITPSYPIRMNGFLSRKQESDGVRMPVYAKALAIGSDQDGPAVLITVDTLGIPAEMTAELGKRLATAGVKPDRLAITASHSHTAPMINGCAPNIFGEPITPEHQAHIDQYTREFLDYLEKAARDALADRRPATMHWGIGLVSFAKNRRDKNGPIDHDLPTLVVRDMAGAVRAVYVSYACHCVTLSEPKLGGDWAGYAQQQIEKRFPAAVAMTSVGCAGDQNPTTGVMNDRFDLALNQGEEIAQEVDRLIASGNLRPIHGPLTSHLQEIDLPLATPPSREEFAKLAELKTPIGYHARVQLAKLDRGEKLREAIRYPISSWAFGDSLAMVFLAGEVVSEYGLRLKTELDGRRVWVNAYANAAPCYIPSEKVLKIGGYEGGAAMIYYDQPTKFAPGLEAPIIQAAKQPLVDRFPPQLAPGTGQGTRPRSPEQSHRMLKVAGDLQVDLVVAEPLVASPVAVDFGPDGKVWVAEMFDYPSGVHGDFGPGGRVRLLTSSRGDGVLDQATVFIDNIPFPTGVTVWRKGVLICAAPDILYAEDATGDGRADIVKKLYSGFGTDNFQARVNSLEVGLDGWVYGSCGLFGGSIKSFASDKPFELGDRDFRIQPDTGAIEPATGRTQQGRVRDNFENWFGCDNSDLCFHYPMLAHYHARNPLAPPPPGASHVPATSEDDRLIPGNPELQLFKLSGGSGIATAACGVGIYRDDALGQAYAGNIFTCEPVNLLVHRLQLTPKDSTFIGRRPSEEQAQEFLASTDTWFRPVQVRTAPDGSLWVLDMYRYVIEHPRWIPPESLAQIDTRAGSEMGRIYRVRPRDKTLPKWPRLDNLSPMQLVAALDSSNGWQRDMAMQLLCWNRDQVDAQVLQALRSLAFNSKRAETRAQAVATWSQLKQISADDCLQLLNDQHPGVRKIAIRLCEAFASRLDATGQQVLARLLEMVVDKDGSCRLQLAYTLGAWSHQDIAQALTSLVSLNPGDKYVLAAVASSLRPEFVSEVAEAIVASESFQDVKSEDTWLTLLPLTIRMVAPADAGNIFHLVAAATQDYPTAKRLKTLATMLARAEKRPELKMVIVDFWKESSVIEDLMSTTRSIIVEPEIGLGDPPMPPDMRAAAITLLAHAQQPESRDADRKLLLDLLVPRTPIPVQMAAIEALLQFGDDEMALSLLNNWRQYSPQLKNTVLDGLLSRGNWLVAVLDAVEHGSLNPIDIDATRRERLLAHRDADIRQRAEKLLAGKLNKDRVAVLESYASVQQMSGDSQRGAELFRKHCSSCHKIGDIGSSVGPDLVPLAGKPVAFFLQEILDPNRNLDSRYMSYTAIMYGGRTLTGLLAAETASAITLRSAEAKEESLLRTEIEDLVSGRASLMPEGLERTINPQEMADVIRFVRGQAQETLAPEKMAAGELARDILNESLAEPDRQKLIPVASKTAAEVITAMSANMPNNEKEEYRRIPWIWRVAVAAGKEGDPEVLRKTIEISLPRPGQSLRDWQAVVIGGGVINGLGLRGDWPKELIDAIGRKDQRFMERWQELLRQSATMADNEAVRKGTRYDALRIVAIQPWPAQREQLLRYLGKEVDAELQMGSVSGLADVDHPEASQLLLDRMADFAPVNRKLAIVALTRGEARQKLLRSAVESGQIKLEELDESARALIRKP